MEMENLSLALTFPEITKENKLKYILLLASIAVLIVVQVLCISLMPGCIAAHAETAGTALSGNLTINENGETVNEDGVVVNVEEEELDEEYSRVIIVPLLINTQNVMSPDFMPNNLVKVGDAIRGTASLQINATVRQAYLVMQRDMEQVEGLEVPMVISAYRSYARQKELYDAKVAQYGVNQKVTAVPGTSEHQYSACVDISTDGTCQNNFAELPTGLWIAENSYKYGFVVRYPESKKEITGINYEPWHIRYVGVEHATRMYEMDMCLEEYCEYLWAHYPNAVQEVSPDQFPAPRWAGDTGEGDTPPSSSDAPVTAE